MDHHHARYDYVLTVYRAPARSSLLTPRSFQPWRRPRPAQDRLQVRPQRQSARPIERVLLKPEVIWQCPSKRSDDVLDLLQRAAEHVREKDRRLNLDRRSVWRVDNLDGRGAQSRRPPIFQRPRNGHRRYRRLLTSLRISRRPYRFRSAPSPRSGRIASRFALSRRPPRGTS